MGNKCAPGCTCGRHSPQRAAAYQLTGVKTCSKCSADKPVAEFDLHHQGKNGPVYHAACKRCRTDIAYTFNRRAVFEKRYGITLRRYEELLREQGGVCKLCGKPEWVIQSGKLRLLSVDHDHLTGEVRGLLCSNCNRALGLLNEDTDLLKRAIEYLQTGGGYPE